MNEINQKVEFENSIKFLKDRELSEFIARLIWEHCEDGKLINKDVEKRLTTVESRDKKVIGAISGGSSILGAAIIWIINIFTKGGN
jgi:hypothetical protein